MSALIRAEVHKLRTTRFAWALGAVVVGIVGGLLLLTLGFGTPSGSSGTATGAHDGSVITTADDLVSTLRLTVLAGPASVVLGVVAITTEERHRTMTWTLLVAPSRLRVLAAKAVAAMGAAVIMALAVDAAALATTAAWLLAGGHGYPMSAEALRVLVVAPLGAALAAGFGIGVGGILWHQVGAILVAFGWVLIAENLLAGPLPRTRPWLPFTGAWNALTGNSASGLLPAWQGGLLFAGYLAVLLAAAASALARRDVD